MCDWSSDVCSSDLGHDWATSLPLFTFMHWRRKWQPTPVFLPGESLLGLLGRTESDTTAATQQQGLCSCSMRTRERRLSTGGAQALLPRGMWNLPRPRIEPVSPALAGGFLTIEPSGKSLIASSTLNLIKPTSVLFVKINIIEGKEILSQITAL